METIILIVLVCSVLFSFLAMIGSFVVPVVTLIVATYFTQNYQKELGKKAEEIGNHAEKTARRTGKSIVKQFPELDFAKEFEKLTKVIRESFDGKTANLAKQIKKATKDGMKEAIQEAKNENPGQTDVVSTVLSKIL